MKDKMKTAMKMKEAGNIAFKYVLGFHPTLPICVICF